MVHGKNHIPVIPHHANKLVFGPLIVVVIVGDEHVVSFCHAYVRSTCSKSVKSSTLAISASIRL